MRVNSKDYCNKALWCKLILLFFYIFHCTMNSNERSDL